MRLHGTISLGRTGGLLAILLSLPLAAFSEAGQTVPARSQTGSTDPDLHELRQEVRELSSMLRDMRAQMDSARNEAVELRQELKRTSDQVRSLQDQIASGGRAGSRVVMDQISGQAQSPSALPEASRLDKLEEDQQLLATKIDDQYQSKVESGSKYRVRLSGIALLNVFSTRGNTDNFDLPDYAMPRDGSEANASFGASLRQSVIGLDVSGPMIAGARTSGDIRADFFGGFPSAWNGITAGIVRLRTAGMRFDWPNSSIVAGQYAPLFSPLSPTSLASVAYPALASEGNLWTWTPQVYAEHRFGLSDRTSVSVQGGIMDPLSGEPPFDPFIRYPQAAELGGRPAYDGRLSLKSGSSAAPFSIGVGGYSALQRWGFGRTIESWAVTTDWQIPMTHWVSLTGELYHGHAIGGLGAAEGRSIALTGDPADPLTIVRPLHSDGGWAQLKVMPTAKLEFNGAFGEDFSIPPSLASAAKGIGYALNPFSSIARNQSAFVNGIYHLRSNLMFSLEYRRLRTADLVPGIASTNQVTMSAATLF